MEYNNKNYAIARIKKHGSGSRLVSLLNHHLRTVDVPNADPKHSDKNRILHQVEDPRAFIREIPKGTKKNACRFVDVLFTATRFDSPDQLKQWTEQTMAFARKHFGEENIALSVLHMDETTPHIHLLFKPVNPKTQKLGAGHWFDGRAKMQKFQDAYHKQVASLGFDRGEPGSRAKHTTIKEFYASTRHAQTAYNEHKQTMKKAYEEVKHAKPTLWQTITNSDEWKKGSKRAFNAALAPLKKVAYLAVTTSPKKMAELEKKAREGEEKTALLEATQEKLKELTGSHYPTSTEINRYKQQAARAHAKPSPNPTPEPEAPKPPKKKKDNRQLPTPFDNQRF
jgi:hypothetical protein